MITYFSKGNRQCHVFAVCTFGNCLVTVTAVTIASSRNLSWWAIFTIHYGPGRGTVQWSSIVFGFNVVLFNAHLMTFP